MLEIIAHYFEVYVIWIWLWGRRKFCLQKNSCVKLRFGNVLSRKNEGYREQPTAYTVLKCYDKEHGKQYATDVSK